MGKRELLIILGFVVAGAVAYQVSAPPAKDGEKGFSFANLLSNMRREMRGNPGHASITQENRLDVPAAITDVRIGGAWSRLEIIGEARADIAYTLQVDSNGPDDAAALGYAKRTQLKPDVLGAAMLLRIAYPEEMRQTAVLTLRVPTRLAVRLDGGNAAKVTHVGSVHLDGVVGDVNVTGVERAVTGTHRNGSLRISEAGSINMTLTSTSADVSAVHGPLTINARNGKIKVTESTGPIEIDETNQEVTIVAPAGTVRVGASGGQVTVDRPRKEVRIDARRTEVEVTVADAVPITALSTEETIRIFIDGAPAMTLDAVASEGGTIQAADLGLEVKTAERESRVTHTFGAPGGPTVALRNQRGTIVIRKTK